jgi:hypothetical protein
MIGDPFERRLLVQYLGESGLTQPCLQAISAILNSGILPERATIVTRIYKGTSPRLQQKHLFLFWNWGYIPLTVIPCGFASGYSGEGPRGFALAICLIREKNIPIDGVLVEKPIFDAIDKGKLKYVDDQIFKDIKSAAETYNWPWGDWVPEKYEEALERGRLWYHSYLQRYTPTNPVYMAIANVHLFNPDVGKKVRLAEDKIRKGGQTEDWQNAGLLIRDAWIELSQYLCDFKQIDTSDIEKDKVIDKLRKLKLDDEIFNLAKASFDLSLKVHHDRKITKEVAIACVRSSIFTMQSIVYKYIDQKGEFK